MDKIKKLSGLKILIGWIIFFTLAYLIFYDIPWVQHFANILGTIVAIVLFVISDKTYVKKESKSRLYKDGFDEISNSITYLDDDLKQKLYLFKAAVSDVVSLRHNNGFKYLSINLNSENNKYVVDKINLVDKRFVELERTIKSIAKKHISSKSFEGFSDIKKRYETMGIIMASVSHQISFIENNMRPEIRDGKNKKTEMHLKYMLQGFDELEVLTSELEKKVDDYKDTLENEINKFINN